MIGDREHDVVGAHENGLDCLGILYGFGSRKEFEEAGANYIRGNVEDILQFV
ncbi:MAG: HAD hydrolase-like protein [Dorea sp.]